ncbi:hypothetical protein [Shewanella sedimentimangrovi]|uniref:Uncharacterized protein n=1 Tax=Shewanella sedimentimangrovi TaxID=2814293 RepID=A0ABX7R0G6_9GAMM|nr:hypothetical protein [Shewanella sedimentimangrovi]QSX37287.1 hypothetical protein JYB85_00025 [Shewanella sedimentimangrovi]
MNDLIALIAIPISMAMPFWYGRRYDVKNQLLFFAATIGLVAIFYFLTLVALLPFYLLKFFIVPQLEELGVTDNVSWLIELGHWIADYVYILLIPLTFWLSRQLHKKYPVFQQNTYKTQD